MAINTWSRNFSKDTRNCKRNEEILSDETALRDEIFKLKRQVMVLRRTNEQNLVKFRKYEDEAKRKDREIEQLMDPRKNADVTKVLSTKGAAILMTLKDQNNALIQMVLNKDVQMRRLLAEMKMSKLYATTMKNVSYKEEIARLKNLLLKSQEKLRENLDKENQAKSMWMNDDSVLGLSSSSEQPSPRDSEELRSVIRSLEAHLRHSNDLLNKKDQEISLLNEEINFLKKLLQNKTSKNKNFDGHPPELHKYSVTDTHSVPQIKVTGIIPQKSKISDAELLQLFQKSPNTESKMLSSSAPASSTRVQASDVISKHKSLSSITGNDCWKDCKVTKTDSTLFHDIAVGKDLNETSVAPELKKEEKVRERNKILTKRREPKKRISKKFAKRKKHGNEKKSADVLELKSSEPEKNEKKVNGQIEPEIFKIMDPKENLNGKTLEIFSKKENSEHDDVMKGIQRNSTDLTVDRDSDGGHKEPEGPNLNENLIKESLTDGIGSENSPTNEENSEDTTPINFLREIHRQRFGSSSESENGHSMKQQAQQVQVEVQIENDGDESGNSTGENSHQREFAEKEGDNCAPDDYDNNNDDDNDVITR